MPQRRPVAYGFAGQRCYAVRQRKVKHRDGREVKELRTDLYCRRVQLEEKLHCHAFFRVNHNGQVDYLLNRVAV